MKTARQLRRQIIKQQGHASLLKHIAEELWECSSCGKFYYEYAGILPASIIAILERKGYSITLTKHYSEIRW